MNKEFKFHYDIIEDLIGDNSVQAFALYLLLKLYFKNSIFYNTSKAQLQKKTGVSYYLLSKNLKQITDNDWAYWTPQGHLCLRSLKHIEKRPKRAYAHFKLNTDMSLSDIIDIIRATMIKMDVNRQMYIYNLRSDRNIKHATYIGRLQKLRQFREVTELNEDRPFTSDRRIARFTGLTLTSAHRLRKRLEKKKILKTTPRVIELQIKSHARLRNFDFGNGKIFKSDNKWCLLTGNYIQRLSLL